VRAEPLLSLAAQVAGEHQTADVLNAIVRGLATEPGVALARLWLLSPGDLCETCFQRAACADQTRCLHLVASAGSSRSSPDVDWSSLDGQYRRIPLGHRKVGEIGTAGRSILIPDDAATSEWIADKQWAAREGIRGFAGYPLVARGEILGVLGIFSRESLCEQDFSWLGIFANQVAVAITNARAFEQIRQGESELRESETKYRSLVDLSPVAIFMLSSDGKFVSANPAGLRLLKCSVSELEELSIRDTYSKEDLARYPTPPEQIAGFLFRFERTFVGKDGSQVPVEVSLSPNFPGGRQAVVQDVSERKRAEEALRQHAKELQQVIDVAPLHMFLWEADGSASYGNRTSSEYFGHIPPKPPLEFLDLVVHPEDVGPLKEGIRRAMPRGKQFEMEARIRRRDGEYRWFLYQMCPLRDETGRITRWCGTRIDIDDRKRTEERAEKENFVLREEIDKVSMFEEIVGSSPALHAVLARVSKVAKSDTTVLITGETGTGKELIARAVHKRSPRAARAFVSVNCAAIPRDLIASELFGHEKGAFTGALQRRLGRFELAEGGTIFLDEIGELNAETQVTLLRVLQEREFERVGGTTPIRANVRVIAATHRDLPALIETGTFRSDLYYRINVFPIDVPPLRKRQEDIRLLVGYFIDRYASKAGKRIRSIDKRTMEALQSYPWPGNIRELQNVIERSVIVSDTEEFAIDESWLQHQPASARPLAKDLHDQERERIEGALRRSNGRVSGPTGAAAALGLPASTLDSKIKALKIDKRRYQSR
jgi:PAS domain S-box-containing protein